MKNWKYFVEADMIGEDYQAKKVFFFDSFEQSLQMVLDLLDGFDYRDDFYLNVIFGNDKTKHIYFTKTKGEMKNV